MKVLLVVYDNDSHISSFPHGLAYIATVLKENGIDVHIYSQDIYHYSENHLTNFIDKEKYDIVGVSIIAGYYQYNKLLKISDAINKSKHKPLYILGGHGPSPEPEYFLKKTNADVVIIEEGEKTIVELIDAIQNKKDLSLVNGIAFLKNNKLIQTPRRKLIKDINKILFPAWDLFDINHYALARKPNVEKNDRVMPVLSGRGCTFKCNFCYRMDKGFRPRSPENIIEEIEVLKKDYLISYIGFSDELLMSSVGRTEELCSAFIKAKLNIKWSCNGRLNYAKPDLLKLMKQAGCVFINYGIESLDEIALKNMNKNLTVKQITEGIENTLSIGISPGFNVIFGNIGETAESLQKGVDFLLKYDDHSQMRTIRPVTPYPGSDLYYYAIKNGLLKGCQDFYENKHTNSDLLTVNFTNLSDDEFHQCLLNANNTLINKYFETKKEQVLKETENLYINKDVSFRGFRQT